MELDPKYVDVIVRRWQEFTGKEATHEVMGQTFNEIEGAPSKEKLEAA
jgi:DNA modification methylase